MLFYSTIEKIAIIITTKKSVLLKDLTTEQTAILRKWTEDDFLCKNYILNGLSNNLYDYYANFNTAKYVWKTLQKKV